MAGMSEEVHVLITLAFPAPLQERLKAVSSKVRLHVHPTSAIEMLPEDLLEKIEVLYTIRSLPDPEAAPNLRWLQLHFAGVDHVIDHPLVQSGIMVTTLSGAAAPQMAEFCLMAMLAMSRRLPRMLDDPPDVRWDDERFQRYRGHELRGSTVGVVGYGSVGREVARLSQAFGANILSIKRDLKNLQDEGYILEGLGDREAEIPDRLYPPEAIGSMSALCDYLVITSPLTSATRGMIGEEVFEKMKSDAVLIDVSRGGVVDQGALVEALHEGRLGGAALDVYPVEPLPTNSPLWKMDNVMLSPHVAGASSHYFERAAELFAENLHRYLSDRPLLNLYDPEAGY
jgi:phosphoglycerate dehydrogenase-like enzyme